MTRKPMHWIDKFVPISSAEGQIKSLLLVMPSKNETGKLELIEPLTDRLNTSQRAIVRFYNDPDRSKDFWDEAFLKKIEEVEASPEGDHSPKENTRSADSSKVRPFLDPRDFPRSFDPDIEIQPIPELDPRDQPRYYVDLEYNFPIEALHKNLSNHINRRIKALKNASGDINAHHGWVQDSFVCLQKGKGGKKSQTTMLFSVLNERFSDVILPMDLAQNRKMDLRCHPTELYLEGGNILVIDECLLIGKDLILENMIRLHKFDYQKAKELDPRQAERDFRKFERKVLDRFEYEFNAKHTIALGSKKAMKSFSPAKYDGKFIHRESFQPFFHLDLYLNFGGIDPETQKRVAFLGCPQYALNLLNGWEGNPQCGTDPGRKGTKTKSALCHPQQGKNIFGTSQKIEDLIEETAPFFEELKEQLKYAGFKVVLVPLFVSYEPIPCSYSVHSWNNALVEIYNKGTEKHIYLPSYVATGWMDYTGINDVIKFLEKKVKKIYQDHGFQVHSIKAGDLFRNAVLRGGSLHCMVKVLSRKYT